MGTQDAKRKETHSTSWVLGVDGGGSKTVAWVGEVSGRDSHRKIERILGKGRSGPGNPRSVGFDLSVGHIREAVERAIAESGLRLSDLSSICVGLAGAGREIEQTEIRQRLLHYGFPNNLSIGNDIEPLHWAALQMFQQSVEESTSSPKATINCVTLVVGTGSIAMGTPANGETQRVGGWGYLLGDQGSGFWIGMRVLQEICQSHDRGSKLTDLQRQALELLSLSNTQELVSCVYAHPLPRTQIASLAQLVMEQADLDPFADSLRCQAIQHWADLIELAFQKCCFESTRYLLAIGGGVAVHALSWVQELQKVLKERRCVPLLCQTVEHPVEGCLVMAMNNIR